MTELRANLPELPAYMRTLPLDARGYPVPFFVKWVDGMPDFRAADKAARNKCVRLDVCWLCGKPLGRFRVFVAGPMCGINRVSAEAPSHRECALFAVKACPFLILPKAKRREANIPVDATDPPGIMLKRNPGVVMVWATTKTGYRIERHGDGLLFRLFADPVSLLFWSEGRLATRAEVDESIETGVPLLLEMAGVTTDADREWVQQQKLVLTKLREKFLVIA